MRFHERALNIRWKKGTKRPDKSNAIDMLCSGLVPTSGIEKEDFEKNFDEVPTIFAPEEREAWLSKLSEVGVSSDAFVSCNTPRHVTNEAADLFLSVPVHRQCLQMQSIWREVHRGAHWQSERSGRVLNC